MKNIPFCVPNSVLHNILELHGEVESIKTCYYPEREGEEFLSGLMTMERTAIMKTIKRPIPSTYYLNLTQSYIYFSHPNQHRTCIKCGDPSHFGDNCPVLKTTAPSERDNALKFSPDEFPDLTRHSNWPNRKINVPTIFPCIAIRYG